MKGKRTDLSQKNCAIARSLGVVGDWWSLLVIRDALLGKQRFSEFQRSNSLAKNILSSRLKKLVEGGIFVVEQDEDAPSVHRYVLTERGRQLGVVIAALWQWGEENCFEPGELQSGLADNATGQMLGKLELATSDGRRIDPRDLQLAKVSLGGEGRAS